jgi:hypothetical protein
MCKSGCKYNIAFLFLILLLIVGCEKEYSYEGGTSVPTTPVTPIDSTQSTGSQNPDPGALAPCFSCIASDTLKLSEWSFKTGNSLLCGTVDTAFILDLERSSFTFFGPSSCAGDSGLIFSVYLDPNALKRDTTNLDASYAVFYYYHTNQPYVLTSHADQSFKLTITSYVHSTRVAIGTFSGYGYREDGRAVNVAEGKFKIKLL